MKKEYAPLKMNDTFPFGKHKGKTLAWLTENEPDYLDWVKNNTDCKLGKDVLDAIAGEDW